MKLSSLEEFCRRLPGATEDIKWGQEQVFSVGGKMFCVFSRNDGQLSGVSFKVPDPRFLEFTDRPQFIPAPYLARARWVTAVDGAGLKPAEMRANIAESHRLVMAKLSRKQQAEILQAHS